MLISKCTHILVHVYNTITIHILDKCVRVGNSTENEVHGSGKFCSISDPYAYTHYPGQKLKQPRVLKCMMWACLRAVFSFLFFFASVIYTHNLHAHKTPTQIHLRATHWILPNSKLCSSSSLFVVLLQVILVFSVLLVAFGLAFYILFSGNVSLCFINPGQGIKSLLILIE